MRVISMNSYFQFIISKHTFFNNTKKLNIILASRTLVTVNLLNSSVVYNSIRNHLHSAHELEQTVYPAIARSKISPLALPPTKTGTAATFSITLVSNFVKRKAFPKRFCNNDNNNSGNMFRGIDTSFTIFMMRHKLQR